MTFRNLPALLALLLLGSAGWCAERPNIVIIYADDLGYGDLACYGHRTFKTPNLDRMAREGVRLTQFYTTCGYCAPSRASLMTGRYPFRNNLMTANPHPAKDYGAPNDVTDNLGIPPQEVTLGEALQEGGYRTICIGKWHLGHKPRFYPTRNGFHEYLGILYSNDMHPVELFDGEKVVEYPVVQATLTRRYTERALKFIENNKEKPFLIYLPHAMPHKPLAPSEEFYKKTKTGLYGDVIAELDWSVGEILKGLSKHGLERKTLVFFTSDNGPWYGGSAGGLRGMKATWWEGGIRVPLIAWGPGILEGGKVIDEPAIILDLFPTVLTAAGVELPRERMLDGKNILPLLEGKSASPHEALYSYQNGLRTVRVGEWKLHRRVPPPHRRGADWIDPRAPNGVTLLAPFEQPKPDAYPGVQTGESPAGWALFNIKDDPSEQHDVAGKNPEIVARLKAKFETMDAEVNKETRKPK